MKYQKWRLRGGGERGRHILEQGGMNPLCAAILNARGITTPEQATALLEVGENSFHDPFLLADMHRAVARIQKAIQEQERMVVYGDYDVDGITSTTLLTTFLKTQGAKVISYIPDRIEEGYGLNIPAIDHLVEQGVKLMITVDCGITAVDEVAHAKSVGLDVIVVDHHHCKEVLPDSVAVIDPRRADCSYPFKELAGVGVTLKLVLALTPEEERNRVMNDYLDLVAVGTVADVMLLTDENRALVRRGLKQLANTRRPGLAALLEETGALDREITAVTIGYTLAPRINAAGRMKRADVALELLMTDSPTRAGQLAVELCDLNRIRQETEISIYEQCVLQIERDPASFKSVIVVAGEGWHPGVIGIVASRLSEVYSCPAFTICLDHGKGKGSCRSFGGFNLFLLLEQCADLLEGFGGHDLAAGFTILEENLPAFQARMAELVSHHAGGVPMESVLDVDVELEDAGWLTLENMQALSVLEPFGSGNPKPVLSISGSVVSCGDVGGGRHLKLRLRCGQKVLDGIFFSATLAEANISPGDRIEVAFTPQINQFNGKRSVQLHLCDLRHALTRAQAEQMMYEKLCHGDYLNKREAAALLPEREDFVAVWKCLKRIAADTTLEDTDAKIQKLLARALPPQRPHIRTAVCLDVLEERGLIVRQRTDGRTCISLTPMEEKVDLEQSVRILQLRALLCD